MFENQDNKELEIIRLITNFLQNYETPPAIKNNIELKKILENTIDSITTVMYELQTNLYYLVVIGGVKSGKSTLTNVLSGEKTATTNLGIETTLYPSIISHGSKNEIITYSRKIGCDENKTNEDLIKLILDNIKGLPNSKEKMQHCIEATSYDFDSDYIKQFVATKSRDDKIILINIKIKSDNDSLIRDNIAIIDTPGIDGVYSSIGGERESINGEQKVNFQSDNNKNIGNLLIQKSTYMIFVQSSIAPITHDNLKFLQGITHPRHTVLVHNKFSINQWRKFEEDLTAQKRNAKQILENAKIKPISFDVDLGKAHDAIFRTEELKDGESYEKLLEESKIMELKKDIIDSIKQNGKKVHINHQIGEVNIALDEITNKANEIKKINTEKIKRIASALNSNFEIINDILEKLTSSQENFKKALKDSNARSGYSENQFELQSLQFPFPTKLEIKKAEDMDGTSSLEKLKNDIQLYDSDTISEELFLQKALEFKQSIVKQHNNNVTNSLNIYEFNRFINEQKQQNETIESYIANISQILNEINANQQINVIQLSKTDIKALEKSIVDVEDIDFVTVGQTMSKFNKFVNWFKSKSSVKTNHISVARTRIKILDQLAIIDSKFNYDEVLIQLLYKHIVNYKSQMNQLKNDIMQDFENKYFKDSLDNFRLVDEFIADFRSLTMEINNVE